MRRKFQILAIIILLCTISGVLYYEYTKTSNSNIAAIQIIYSTIPDDVDWDNEEEGL